MVSYGIIMACYSVHGPMEERVGHMEHSGSQQRVMDILVMLQPVGW